jgi:hypothetical protein
MRDDLFEFLAAQEAGRDTEKAKRAAEKSRVCRRRAVDRRQNQESQATRPRVVEDQAVISKAVLVRIFLNLARVPATDCPSHTAVRVGHRRNS